MKVPASLSSYQRSKAREMLNDGYEIVEYGRLDGDWATLVMRRGDYKNLVAFPRSAELARFHSAYS